MYGIEKLKDAIAKGVILGMEVEKRWSDDDRLTALEIVGLTPHVWRLKSIIGDAKQIWLEFKDLDAQEQILIIDHIKKIIPDKYGSAERIIEQSFKVLVKAQELGVEVEILIEIIKEENQD